MYQYLINSTFIIKILKRESKFNLIVSCRVSTGFRLKGLFNSRYFELEVMRAVTVNSYVLEGLKELKCHKKYFMKSKNRAIKNLSTLFHGDMHLV